MRKTQVQSRAETTTSLRTEVTTEVSKVSIVLVGVFAAIVGLWSLACIVGGIVSSGGVGGLLSGWLKAITGM